MDIGHWIDTLNNFDNVEVTQTKKEELREVLIRATESGFIAKNGIDGLSLSCFNEVWFEIKVFEEKFKINVTDECWGSVGGERDSIYYTQTV